MIRKLARDALQAEVTSLREVIDRSSDEAPLTAMSARSRLAVVEQELAALDREAQLTGEVALFFTGKRVQGSRAIDAEFATSSVRYYQDLVSKTVLRKTKGPLGQRGPLGERDVARLNITGTAPGSFGFVLEEDGAEQSPLFPTAVKEAMESVTILLQAFAASEDAAFVSALDDLDPRTLKSLKDLLGSLKEAEATMRIVEGEHDLRLDRHGIEVALERADQTSVEEREVMVPGRVEGFGPHRRTFEFRREDTGGIILGRIGPQLSQEFLRRISEEPLELGQRRIAQLLVRETERRGATPRLHYTLLNLLDAPEE